MKVILTEDEALNAIYSFWDAKIDTFKSLIPAPLDISIERDETVNEELVSVKRLEKTVRMWAQDGENKIAMIRSVRSLTGWGLRESKDFVEENSIPF